MKKFILIDDEIKCNYSSCISGEFDFEFVLETHKWILDKLTHYKILNHEVLLTFIDENSRENFFICVIESIEKTNRQSDGLLGTVLLEAIIKFSII